MKEECIEHIDGEPCLCEDCQKESDKLWNEFKREFRLYCIKDEDGNLIDMRDIK